MTKMINIFDVIIIIIIIIRLISSMTCSRAREVMCCDSLLTAGIVIEPVEENWCHGEISSTWQTIPQWLLIFRQTHTLELISLSPYNETVSHDSCLPVRRNLISIFPCDSSRWDRFLIKLITINERFASVSLQKWVNTFQTQLQVIWNHEWSQSEYTRWDSPHGSRVFTFFFITQFQRWFNCGSF